MIQDPATGYNRELYDLTKYWTLFDDVAAKHPAKLKELQKLSWIEAKKYQGSRG